MSYNISEALEAMNTTSRNPFLFSKKGNFVFYLSFGQYHIGLLRLIYVFKQTVFVMGELIRYLVVSPLKILQHHLALGTLQVVVQLANRIYFIIV